MLLCSIITFLLKTHSHIHLKNWMGLGTRLSCYMYRWLIIITKSLISSPSDLQHIHSISGRGVKAWLRDRCNAYVQQCSIYAILFAEDVSTKLRGFNTSLQNDLAAVANISDRIDRTSLATFMNIMEGCSGQILTSGIGRFSLISWTAQNCIITQCCFS